MKRCLFPLLCTTLFVVGCVQRQAATGIDPGLDSAAIQVWNELVGKQSEPKGNPD